MKRPDNRFPWSLEQIVVFAKSAKRRAWAALTILKIRRKFILKDQNNGR